MNSWHHAQSAARKWGGTPEDYIAIEEFIDSSKKIIGDVRHRSMYHHTAGVWLCQEIFGRTIEVGDRAVRGRGIAVPVRLIAERHILEDLGWLPSPVDYGARSRPGRPARTPRPGMCQTPAVRRHHKRTSRAVHVGRWGEQGEWRKGRRWQ